MSVTYIDEEMGYMDLRIDAQNFPLTERVFNTVYPLHTGKTGSLIYKLWITFFGIGAALLSSLGMTSFIKSKIGNR